MDASLLELNSLALRLERLVAHLHSLLDESEIARQAVADVVDVFNFDFATVSVVDRDQALVRCIAGKNAAWVDDSRHTLRSDDVQSETIRLGKVHCNAGAWEPCLDKRI